MGSSQPGARRVNVRPPRTELCTKCLGQIPKSVLKKHVQKCKGKISRQRDKEPAKVNRPLAFQPYLQRNDTSTWGHSNW